MSDSQQGVDDKDANITAEEFAALTLGDVYTTVANSGEELFFTTCNDQGGEPFALFALVVASPERVRKYVDALQALKAQESSGQG